MEELVQKAIEDITYASKIFPEESFRIISEGKEFAIPRLRAAVKKAISEKDDLDEDYQLHFYALHLLGQFQDTECFPEIMELASLPEDVLDYLIGDTVTTSLPDILYNTYNGDLESFKGAIENPDIDDFVKCGMLNVMGQLYLDGDLKKEEWKDYLRKIVYDEEDIGDFVYTELANMICQCHFVDMLPEIRRLFEDNRIDVFSMGRYEDCVDMMFQYDKTAICNTPIHAADMLRGWAMFEKPSQKKPKKIELKNQHTVQKSKVKIGRNDPCPCGSGKKYKKCCLNKPKSPVDLIESEQEKNQCLEEYPVSAQEREEGRIYLEDFYDSESIEIDKLIYLALKRWPCSARSKKEGEAAENRARAYLCDAFLKFSEKTEKENIKTFEEYDDKYAIHYQCKDWFNSLLLLLEDGENDQLYRTVIACYKRMDG